MRWPRFQHVPPGFGGGGAPRGFGAAGAGGNGSQPAPARRARRGTAPKVIGNPTSDARLRPFTEIVKEAHNSLVRQGFLVRDNDLNWAAAPNPFLVARDPTAADAANLGDFWINSGTNAVFVFTPGGWVPFAVGSGLTGTFNSGTFP